MRAHLVVLPLLVACKSGPGSADVTTWVEEASTDGLATDDGWTVTFDHWLAAFQRINLTNQSDGADISWDETGWIVDYADRPDPAPLVNLDAPESRVDLNFVIGPPTDLYLRPAVSDPNLVNRLVDEQLTQLIVGSATDGTSVKTFSLGFYEPVSYEACQDGADDRPGLEIHAAEGAPAVITLHAAHLFWTHLDDEAGETAFQAWADADTSGDGVITDAELNIVDVATIGYGVGDHDVNTLREFINQGMPAIAHLNGDGPCTVNPLL